jgi:hypothetical protein
MTLSDHEALAARDIYALACVYRKAGNLAEALRFERLSEMLEKRSASHAKPLDFDCGIAPAPEAA